MSDSPYGQENGNNYFARFDAFKPANDSWLPTPSQPAFGHTWAGSAWNSMPMASYNFSSSFQPGFPLAQNDPFDPYQLPDTHEYSGEDDFYGSEKGLPKNILVDSNERRRTSLASQVNLSPTSESSMAPTNTPTATAIVQPQDRDGSLHTPIPTTTNYSSNKGSDARLTELRQKLLASKRANSATPLPSNTNKISGTVVDDAGKEAIGPENLRSSEQTVQNKDANANAPSIRRVPPLPENNSLPNVSNPVKSAPAQTDIQGLIDEYRAPDTVRDPEKPPNLAKKGDKLKRPSKSAANKIGSEPKRIEEAKPHAVTTNTPLKPPSGSPGGSESGEIRSDQESLTPKSPTDRIQSSARKSEGKPSSGLKSTAAVRAPDKPAASKLLQGSTHISKPTLVSGAPEQALQPQAISEHQSAKSKSESRAVPLAQKFDYLHKGANQAPNLQLLPGDRPQRGLDGDQNNNGSHRNAKLSSSLARPAPPQAYSKARDEVQKYQQGSEETSDEKQVARSQEQAAEQHQISSLPQAELDTKENLPSEQQRWLHRSTPTGLALSAGVSSDKPRQHTKREVAQGRNMLSLTQQEQIQKLGIDLTPEGLTDLYEFLEYHRFFVKEYREGFLARQRRLKALEAEKLALERESLMQYELFNSMRAQSLAAREPTEPPGLVGLQDSKESIETPSTKPMPPPLSLPRKSDGVGVIAIKGRASIVEALSPKNPASRANGDVASSVIQGGSNRKRQHLDEEGDLDRSRKSGRMDLDGQPSDRSQQVSPRTSGSEHQILDRRRVSEFRPADYGHRDRSRSPNTRPRSLSPYRQVPDYRYPSRQNSLAVPYTRERDPPRPGVENLRRDSSGALCRNCDRTGHFAADCRDARRGSGSNDVRTHRREDDGFHNDGPAYPSRGNRASSTSFRGGPRGGRSSYEAYRPYRGTPARHGAGVPSRSESLNLKAGDSRYFMIKSWNVENVEAAQRDCIWATQSKNLNVLTEAFNSCRNVILVFSVNGSRAFFGYARMQSLPSADIPAPEWQKVLLWSSTDPFRIEWITVAETRFHAVGHLKNAYNEGQAVLIGRDGQEIEEVCGRGLCKLIDETAKEQARYEDRS
ncbi:MAG: hypothetical protein Q9196_003587 [Gyalolechia fulgens]